MINVRTSKNLFTKTKIIWIPGLLFFIPYFLSMVIFPFYYGGWEYVSGVWDDWQTLNASVLALIASIIAFYISNYNADKQRELQFVAARAFLPHALSELNAYCKSSASLLREIWILLGKPHTSPVKLESEMPTLPESYKEIFNRCIVVADRNVADYLANILVKLQIHHSRLNELKDSFGGRDDMIWVPENIKYYIFHLGELKGLIDKIFKFARSTGPFDGEDLSWEDYRNSYGILDIDICEICDLEEITRRCISRKNTS